MAANRDKENWSRRPKKEDMPLTYLVNRAGPKGHQPTIILSHDVEGGYVHFIRGRSVKCPDSSDCQYCPDKERRWRGYVIVADARTRELSLLELTAAAMQPIDTYFNDHRTLRGALLQTKRIPVAVNGRLYSSIIKAAVEIESYPKVPSVKSLLRKLWSLPKLGDENGKTERKKRQNRFDEDPDLA